MSADVAAAGDPATDPAVPTDNAVTGAGQGNDVTANDVDADGPMADTFKGITIAADERMDDATAADEHNADAINPVDENTTANDSSDQNGVAIDVSDKNGDAINASDKNGDAINASDENGNANGGNALDADARKADQEEVSGRTTDRRHGGHKSANRDDNWRPSRAYSHYDRRNIKSRYDNEPLTDDPVEIRRRVEFYLGDSNLSSDLFLYRHVGGSENHAMDLKIITNFKRMACFQPYSAVVKALKESDKFEIIDSDKLGQEKIRRKTPLPTELGKEFDQVKENYEKLAIPKTVYLKGFGEEDKNTQIALEKFFLKYGVHAVRLRRYFNGMFKGSVFVEFNDEESAKQFLELEPKPTWNGSDLIIKSKAAYLDEKLTQYALKDLLRGTKDTDDKKRGRRSGGKRGRGNRGHGSRGDRDRGSGSGIGRGNRDSHDVDADTLQKENWRDLAAGKKDVNNAEQEHEIGDKVQPDHTPDPEASATKDSSKDGAQVLADTEVENAHNKKDQDVEVGKGKDGDVELTNAQPSKKRVARDDFEDGHEAKKAKADDA